MRRWFFIPVLLLTTLIPAGRILADDADLEFFEKKIRPLLVDHCYECHSAESKKLGGGLLLDSRDGVSKGGDSGAVVEKGKPAESLLIRAIRYEGDAVNMPPKGKLPAAAIADFEEWVKRGTPDSRTEAKVARPVASWADTLRERRDWWSLHPVQPQKVPTPRGGTEQTTPIDRFILEKLESNNLPAAAAASDRVLARRLNLALTGLPPHPERLTQFLTEAAQPGGRKGAVERLVDELLASPHFGERWARHWMDVVRFTETHGNEWNYEVHHAWRYRDYLIRAFNADLPYDQFVREHLAGDLLAHPRWNEKEQFNESVIGTAFYRFGEVNHDDCISLRELGYDLLDNQIDTLTKAFQSTTVACARCHDHKLDAVSSKDYYAMLGILRSSRMVSQTLDAPDYNAAPISQLEGLKPALRQEIARLWREETAHIPRYLLAAQAKRANLPNAAESAAGLDAKRLEKWVATLGIEKAPLEDLWEPWRRLATVGDDPTKLTEGWQKTVAEYAQQDRERNTFNQSQFKVWADFREPLPADWQSTGAGPRTGRAKSGDFILQPEGNAIVKSIVPAGLVSHRLSEKLNGVLRSPVLPTGAKHISFRVIGQRSSALRLVSNHCQLNYKNYRALTSADWQWVTFAPPADLDSLRTYAELMTMFDNPKFPDQLSPLGNDPANYKIPWDKAAENPRSYYGVSVAVLHDGPEPPRADLAHLRFLLSGSPPTSLADLAGRYAAAFDRALQAWVEDRATDEDSLWLDTFVRRELIHNEAGETSRLAELLAEYRRIDATIGLPRIAPGIAESGTGYDQPQFVRGDCHRPGEPVSRRYLEVLSGGESAIPAGHSGRLELAEQIASPQNPLTARVMVNRVWHHLFGAGLVRTVDDFGHVGDLPSHPELLDWLAGRFVADGWSMKKLIRQIVLTDTFQASNTASSAARDVDPQNRWLSYYPARRLEAEAIRDLILTSSGRIDLALFGMSVQPYREKEYADRRLFPGPLDGNGRRSIYIKNNLMESPKFLGVFNFPGGKVAQGRRDVTNVPAQALALLNDPFVLQQSEVWGKKLAERPDATIAARIDVLFETALGRPPSESERQRFEQGAMKLAELHQVPAADVLKSAVVWKELAHATFNLQEFVYIP